MKKIKEYIKIKLHNKIKQSILSDITNNLGKTEICDDKIICYVHKKNLKKIKKGKYLPIYKLFLKNKEIYPEQLLNKYELNKPIDYIIEGIEFSNALLVAGGENKIHFKNCIFNDEIHVLSNDTVIFEDNKYIDNYGFYTSGSKVFFDISAKNVTFINDNYVNGGTDIYNHCKTFSFNVEANDLIMENSNFDLKKYDGDLSIKTNNLIMKDSNVKCDHAINIEANNINSINSSLESKTEINIKNSNSKNNLSLYSPKIIFNGINMTKYSVIDNNSINVQKSRLKLVEQLKKLRDCCNEEKEKELEHYKNKLNKRSVVKTFKK